MGICSSMKPTSWFGILFLVVITHLPRGYSASRYVTTTTSTNAGPDYNEPNGKENILNLDSIFNHQPFMDQLTLCLVFGRSCEALNNHAKGLFPMLLATKCEGCTKTQRTKMTHLQTMLKKHYNKDGQLSRKIVKNIQMPGTIKLMNLRLKTAVPTLNDWNKRTVSPETVPAMESPTPPTSPTTSPEIWMEATEVIVSRRNPVVESTIDDKPTTVEP